MNAVRAVCFDLDNTLWDIWPVIARAEESMYEFLRERYPRVVAEVTLEMMRAARERVALENPQKQHDFSFLRQQSLREYARMFGYAAEMAEEAFDVFLSARNEVDLYSDVRPALEKLRAKYRLFTATNGNADLHRIGIAHYFERSLAARDVGALKPDPAIFHKIVDGTGMELRDVVYVGDDPQHDVEGSRRAGMRAIWINRTGAEWPEHLEPPERTVGSLDDLVQVLGL
jgi:putative hydrolase of the HAD superfamily